MKETLRLRLSGGPTAPARARTGLRSLQRTLQELGDDAGLIVSELVTNAVVHAHADLVELYATADSDHIRIEVSDPGPGFDRRSARREPSLTGEGGYGLNIIDKLSNRWGVSNDGRARVWLEIDHDGAGEGRFRSSGESRSGFRQLAAG
jgi:anti-sigma regulatory factor (Ser/Thr protein kinase)